MDLPVVEKHEETVGLLYDIINFEFMMFPNNEIETEINLFSKGLKRLVETVDC